MNVLIIILIATAFISGVAQIIDKKLINMGISRKDYFFLMCLSMIPFSIIMTLFEYHNGLLKFEFNVVVVILLILAMLLRYIKQHTVVGVLKHLNPYENASYMSIPIVIAYIIDIFIGSEDVSLLSLIAIVFILCGIIIMSISKFNLGGLKKDLFVKICTTLLISYVTYFALQYISNALFLLTINLVLTIIFFKGYKFKYLKENSIIVKWVFIQQSFGFIYLYLNNFLISNSVTLSSCVQPTALIMLLIFSSIHREKEKPKLIQIAGIISIVIGLFMIIQ